MLNIVIVAKDSHYELYKTLRALKDMLEKRQFKLSYIYFYSAESKLPSPKISDYEDLNLNLVISNDTSVYSAMNFALKKVFHLDI